MTTNSRCFVNAIVSAQAPNATAFSVSERAFDTRSTPESYILLRDVPKPPCGMVAMGDAEIEEPRRHFIDRQLT